MLGVGPGLGRDLALRFSACGADVVLAARRAESLRSVAAEVGASGRRALSVQADVADAASIDALFARVAAEVGRLDTLVYNAFVPPSFLSVAETPEADWRASFEVHVLGAARTATAATPLLEAAGGSIVFVNTQAARRSESRRGAYSATKAALLSLARTLAGELGPRGIRVNSVVPGQIWGPALEGYLAERAAARGVSTEAFVAEVTRPMALRRIATGTEVADAAVFFASGLASGITGQSLDVNAGNWYE